MKITCHHADTCLSDYWTGHHLPHVMVPAYRQTFASLRNAIISELSHGAVMGSSDDARLLSGDFVGPGEEEEKRADKLMRAARAAVRRDVRPAKKGARTVFADISESDGCEETVYAFFVFSIEE